MCTSPVHLSTSSAHLSFQASRAAAQAWAFTAPYRAFPEYEESIREEQTYNPWVSSTTDDVSENNELIPSIFSGRFRTRI